MRQSVSTLPRASFPLRQEPWRNWWAAGSGFPKFSSSDQQWGTRQRRCTRKEIMELKQGKTLVKIRGLRIRILFTPLRAPWVMLSWFWIGSGLGSQLARPVFTARKKIGLQMDRWTGLYESKWQKNTTVFERIKTPPFFQKNKFLFDMIKKIP